jgi:hypothetical protein
MGSGSFKVSSYATYSTSLGRTYDKDTGRVTGQTFESKHIDPSLDPKKFKVRECANSDEHPNTVPVILALDVTGSMGEACNETAAALGVIVTNLYDKFKDIEFCIMGIGDLAYDNAPIQMSQFESDVRIAEALDKIYIEHGGGGNGYESYTAAWYMGLKRTKLDAYDKQGRKGIIITMGDEPLNPYLPKRKLNEFINATEEINIETPVLYKEASKKFDIYHISVDDSATCYRSYKARIEKSFGKLLGNNYRISTINQLAKTIEDCISESLNSRVEEVKGAETNEKGEISW